MHINLVELTNKFVARENVVNYVCPTSSAHKRTNFLRHHRKDFSFKFFFLKPNITSQNSVFIQNAGIIFIKYKMLVIFREILWVAIMKWNIFFPGNWYFLPFRKLSKFCYKYLLRYDFNVNKARSHESWTMNYKTKCNVFMDYE